MTDLCDGDIAIVNGKGGIYENGKITLSTGEITEAKPEIIIRFYDDLPPAVTVENIEMPIVEFGNTSPMSK